jgi:hypothetical protein
LPSAAKASFERCGDRSGKPLRHPKAKSKPEAKSKPACGTAEAVGFQSCFKFHHYGDRLAVDFLLR